MAPDPPLAAFLDTLRRSRLLDPAELDRLANRAGAPSAIQFAEQLTRAGELTHYQADKLLRGLSQGLVVGPYSVLAPLGRGGMGTVVYLARDRRMSESLGDSVLVALKLLPNRIAAEHPRALARFRREIELGRRTDHPNVVRSLASGEQDGVHFLALEFVPGKTITRLVVEQGPLPVGEAARVFADVAAGLEHLHGRGLVHRDVKPSNVVVRPDGRAVLLDLGLALAPGEPLPEDSAVAGGPGYVVGTMDYLAPEQAVNAVAVGPRADLYGLGCSLFFALTGAVPFPAEGTKEKFRRHRLDPVPFVETAPVEFAQLVQWLMAKSSWQRPGSAEEVRELLLPWATQSARGAGVDVLAAADSPGLDAGLWEAVPGADVGDDESPSASSGFAQLEANDELQPVAHRGWVLAAVLAAVLVSPFLLMAIFRLL